MGTLRKAVRLLAAGILYYSGFFWLWNFARRRNAAKMVCVLGLHRVLTPGEETEANSLEGMVIRRDTFAQLLEYVRRHFRVISMEEFLADTKESDGRPACLITFDDGWRDNLTTALPELKKYGVPATIFLATGFIDSSATFWVERLKAACRDRHRWEELRQTVARETGRHPGGVDLEIAIEHLKHMPAAKRQALLSSLLPATNGDYSSDRMLSWAEIEVMQRAGIDFGGHSDTHPLLPYEPEEAVAREVWTCKQKIEEHLGGKVRAFAYPNGDWNDQVRRQVAQAGYECAFTTQRGWYRAGEDRYTIRRILLHEGCVVGLRGKFSPAAFNLKLTGWR